MPTSNKERQTRYMLLRKAGFKSKDATRFKDLSLSTINELINARNEYNKLEQMAYESYLILEKEILKNG